jgi:MFS family permease
MRCNPYGNPHPIMTQVRTSQIAVPVPESALPPIAASGKWLALTAALLGWMFDGLEMGLFPLAGRPALRDLLQTGDDTVIGRWIGVAMATFLVGAATGGVVFGWLGDRIGRVRAMAASVLCYSVFTGAGAVVQDVGQLVILRFIAALGMGGEWSLGVALVNEVWPGRSRPFLAGLIGASANVGFLLIGVVGMLIPATTDLWQLPLLPVSVAGWRLLMTVGTAPALLTFFIWCWVPESAQWQRERGSGATAHWATRDLIGVVIGAAGACLIIVLWAGFPLNAVFGQNSEAAANALSKAWFGLSPTLIFTIVIAGSLFGLIVTTLGFLYPVKRYLERSELAAGTGAGRGSTIPLMLVAAGLSGVALLGTWGSVQWAPTWADQLVNRESSAATFHKEWTQICAGFGAVVGTILAALLCDRLGRRPTYCLLCVGALASIVAFYQPFNENVTFGPSFLFWACVMGAVTASFYGLLPLYLPELFRTSVRAIGTGFGYNFGRILAAVGALQTGALTALFAGNYPLACTAMSLLYLAGLGLIWLAPETKGKPLPQ